MAKPKRDDKVSLGNRLQAMGSCISAGSKAECDKRTKIVSKIDPDLFCEWSTTRRSTEIGRERVVKATGEIGPISKEISDGFENLMDAIEVRVPITCTLAVRGSRV